MVGSSHGVTEQNLKARLFFTGFTGFTDNAISQNVRLLGCKKARLVYTSRPIETCYGMQRQ
jgi:hypothetical protein